MSVNIIDLVHTKELCDFYTERIDLAIRLKDDWDKLIAEVGFTKVYYFGRMNFTQYDKKTSKRLIAVVEK